MKKHYIFPETDEDTRYCSSCGSVLLVHKLQVLPRFNPHTGIPEYHYYRYWRCPNKMWYFDDHEQFDDAPRNYYP